MNRERLETMRVMLERVVAGSWRPTSDMNELRHDMGRNFIPSDTESVFIERVDLHDWAVKKPIGCGFTACAVGHACFDEHFIKDGLRWYGNTPQFGEYYGWFAVREFFGITQRHADKLFLPKSYSSDVRAKYLHLPGKVREAKMVADRIQTLLSKGVV